jgi:hypothetical protein
VVPAKFPVAIHGHPYNIEPRLCRRAFLQVQKPAQDQTPEPGEASVSAEGLWRRSQSDWSLGAGQVWLDEEESTRRRFFSSLGVDVFNDREATLLPETEEKRNSANSNLKTRTVANRLYIMDGTGLHFSDAVNSEQAASWSFTAATGLPGGNLLDFTFSGSHVYVLAADNSIYRATVGTAAFTLYYNPTAVMTNIYAALGRLFASETNKLYEITSTPGETLIFTHPDPNYTFSSLCGAPTGVYFAGNIINSGELRHTWVRDDGAAFVAPVVVAEFGNEKINVCRGTGNVMVIGTSLGFRKALIDGGTTGLTFGPVVPVGDIRDITIDSVGPETFAWFTWTAIQANISGLGRIRLSRDTEPLVPAYASDIYAIGGNTIISCASIRSRRYFAASGDGFYGAKGTKVATGTLVTGRIRFGLLDLKSFATLRWRSAPLFGAIGCTITFDTGEVIPAGSQATEGSLGTDNVSLGPVQAEYGEMTFTLTRSSTDTTKGPTLRWWVMRGLAQPDGAQRFLVALKFDAKTQTPRGPIKAVNVESELEFLAALIAHRQEVKYQRGKSGWSVYVENFEERPEMWNPMTHVFEGIVMVQMVTLN